MSSTPTDVLEMWQMYCDSWAATNPQRQQLLERCLIPTFRMVGHHNIYEGYDGLQKAIDGFQGKVPGAVFKTKKVKAHHSFGQVEWEVVDGSGEVVMSGVDFLELAADGRIVRAVAFLS